MNRHLLSALFALPLLAALSVGARAMEHPAPGGHGSRHCPNGTHRISLPDEALRCYADAPNCPNGTSATETGNNAQPWLCAGCPTGANCSGCPNGQHNVLVHQWGRPYQCVSNIQGGAGSVAGGGSSGAGSAGGVSCPAGTHPVITHQWGQPYQCVRNLVNNHEGFGGPTLTASGAFQGNAGVGGAITGSGGSQTGLSGNPAGGGGTTTGLGSAPAGSGGSTTPSGGGGTDGCNLRLHPNGCSRVSGPGGH